VTERQRKPMSPATQNAMIRGILREMSELKEELGDAVASLALTDRVVESLRLQIETKKVELARARKGQW
jgi:hypothetical protein